MALATRCSSARPSPQTDADADEARSLHNSFLRRFGRTACETPLLWMECIETYRVTHSWSPNFGFKLVAKAIEKSTTPLVLGLSVGASLILDSWKSARRRLGIRGDKEPSEQLIRKLPLGCECASTSA